MNMRTTTSDIVRETFVFTTCLYVFAGSCAAEDGYENLRVGISICDLPQMVQSTHRDLPEAMPAGICENRDSYDVSRGAPIQLIIKVENVGLTPTAPTSTHFSAAQPPFRCWVAHEDEDWKLVEINHNQLDMGLAWGTPTPLGPGGTLQLNTFLFAGFPEIRRTAQGVSVITPYVFDEPGSYRLLVEYLAGSQFDHFGPAPNAPAEGEPDIITSQEIAINVEGAIPNWDQLVEFGVVRAVVIGYWREYVEGTAEERAAINSAITASQQGWLEGVRSTAQLAVDNGL